MKIALLIVTALLLHGCGCARYCVAPQTRVLHDASGAPLVAARVVGVDGTSYECGSDDFLVQCAGNRITFDQTTSKPYRLRVEAVSGEVFDAEFTPKTEATGMAPGCCVSAQRFVDQTVTLETP